MTPAQGLLMCSINKIKKNLTRYMAVECPISEQNLARISRSGGALRELESQ